MATARKHALPIANGRTPAFQPDYPDEVSEAQLEAIRLIVGDTSRGLGERALLYSPAW